MIIWTVPCWSVSIPSVVLSIAALPDTTADLACCTAMAVSIACCLESAVSALILSISNCTDRTSMAWDWAWWVVSIAACANCPASVVTCCAVSTTAETIRSSDSIERLRVSETSPVARSFTLACTVKSPSSSEQTTSKI